MTEMTENEREREKKRERKNERKSVLMKIAQDVLTH